MQIDFVLNSPPFSINSAYYRNRKRTRECRLWGDNILRQIQAPHIMTALQKIHDIRPNSLSVELIFSYPKSKLFTKSSNYEKISKFSMDLSNIEKLLIDLIFDKRYNDRLLDNKPLSNLNLDDKIITKLTSSKVVNENDLQQIQIIIST